MSVCHSNPCIYNTGMGAFVDLKSESADWCQLKIWGSAHLRRTEAHAATSPEAEVLYRLNSQRPLCLITRSAAVTSKQRPSLPLLLPPPQHWRRARSVARSECTCAVGNAGASVACWTLQHLVKPESALHSIHVYFDFTPDQGSKVYLRIIQKCVL